MAKSSMSKGYGFYFTVWLVLLVVTLIMVLIDRPATLALRGSEPPVSEGFLIFVLVVAMLVKAGLIAGYFMHLRFESGSLVVIITISLIATALLLFGLISVEGLSVIRLSTAPG